MDFIKCDHLRDGGPAPSVYYAIHLRASFREVCSFCSRRSRARASELEPLWHFVETIAMARLFGVDRRLYDQIDRQITRMNRTRLVELALRSFLTPSLGEYMKALGDGAVTSRDAVMFYLRIRATYDWMLDNTVVRDCLAPELDELLIKLKQIVDEHRRLLVNLVQTHPDIRVFWREIVRRTDQSFLAADAALAR